MEIMSLSNIIESQNSYRIFIYDFFHIFLALHFHAAKLQ